MPHLLPFRFAAFFLAPALLLASGCCANNVCDCQDAQADAVALRFSSAFSAADLDTLVIQRSPLPYRATTKAESVTLIRTGSQVRDSVLLNNNTPFTQVGSTKLNGYRYVVQYLVQRPGGKPVPTTALVIDSTRLRGSLSGNGCCTCYANSQKTVYARKDGAAQDSVFDLKQKPYILVTR